MILEISALKSHSLSMPIYEYYCPDCHAIYNFFARTMGNLQSPDCPRCSRKKLERQISSFAFISGHDQNGDEDMPFDEDKMMAAMESLAGEAASIDENNPREAADLIRKFTKMTGMELNDTMAEALSRLEAGEDPESIENELGSQLDEENPFSESKNKGALSAALRRQLPPRRDETLYDL